ncbi:MAG: hypothetical protein G01um10148_413 [Parcubacteria group bacterium Gr01-1014_8]|nr:MAG: hypothetical protein G01um10148_413 [Parcubacteria group bacterium Gr01-1014_8]
MQTDSFFSSISRYALIVLVGLFPFFFVPGGTVIVAQGKMLIATLLVAIAGVSWCVAVLFGSSRIPRHSVIALAALLPIAYAISAILSGWPTSSIVSGVGVHDTVVSAALYFAALLVGAAVFAHATKGIVWFLRSLLVGTLVLMLFQAVRLMWPEPSSFGVFLNQASTAAGSWHDFGIVLGLSVILSLLLLRTSVARSLLWRACLFVTAIAGLMSMVIVNMADIWYVFGAVSFLIAIYVAFRPFEGNTLLQIALWVLLAAASAALGYFGSQVYAYLPAPVQVAAVEVRPSWEGTFAIGQEALGESRTLFFGSGPNSFNRSWALHKPTSVNATDFWAFDFNAGVGVLPTAFVTLGVFGLAAWLLTSVGFLAAMWRMFRRKEGNESSIAFSLAASVLFLFIFHVMYAPGFVASMLLFILLGLFVATSLTVPRDPVEQVFRVEENSASKIDMIGAALAAILIVVISGVSMRALASDMMVNKAVVEFAKDRDSGAASMAIERALVIWPSNERAHRAAVELGVLSLSEQGAKANDPEAQARLQATLTQAIQHGLSAVSIGRTDYQNWLTLAQLYQELAGAGVGGAYEQAREAYATARAENPTNPVPVFRLAQLEAVQGNRDAAIGLLKETIQLKQNFAAAYYLISQLYAEKQQYQEATEASAIAVQLVPQDPLGWYNLGTILYASKQNRDAAAAFSQAITLMPNYSNAIFMLALTYAQLGETDSAALTMARVAELNPDDAGVQRMVENIKAKKDPFTGL